jgi:hypothetical protein
MHNASIDESQFSHFVTLMMHKNPSHVLDIFGWMPLPVAEYSCTVAPKMSSQSLTGVFF